ncbi:MAG TPA: intradiol ring-cleavage dioxygenase [Casimicrobiaceae bacterium]|jgi:protocatechuate 3,4-dioxygenase beta subunit
MHDDDCRPDSLRRRRRTLALLGSSAALLATRRGLSWAADAPRPACIARPQQTEGPFFVDGDLERSDLRSDPRTGAVKQGVPLRLAFHVSRVGDSSCAPLAGAQVHVWHCDAAGTYSAVRDRRGSTAGDAFLRGFQTTEADGIARFATVYPGWYPGRAVHVHFKIRTTEGTRTAEFTSQLYFDDALSERVFAAAPYARRGRPEVRNSDDFLFRHGGRQLLVDATADGEGYAAVFDIGLQA